MLKAHALFDLLQAVIKYLDSRDFSHYIRGTFLVSK